MKQPCLHPFALALLLSLFALPACSADPAASSDDEVDLRTAVEMLPETLHDAEGNEIPASSLEDKVVAIYFTALWCPPCRAFTPSLVDFHKANSGDDFEIVLASLDNSEEEKSNYIREYQMEWPSAPGFRTPEIEALAAQFGVRGIPALVVLAPDGTVISQNGRDSVANDPENALQKWKEAASR